MHILFQNIFQIFLICMSAAKYFVIDYYYQSISNSIVLFYQSGQISHARTLWMNQNAYTLHLYYIFEAEYF